MDFTSEIEILMAAKEIVDANDADILSTGDRSASDTSDDECERKSFLHSTPKQMKAHPNSWTAKVSRQRSIPTKGGGYGSRGHVSRYVTMPSHFGSTCEYVPANVDTDTSHKHTHIHTVTHAETPNDTADEESQSEAPYVIKGTAGVKDVLVESEYESLSTNTHTNMTSQPWWAKLLCCNVVLKPQR